MIKKTPGTYRLLKWIGGIVAFLILIAGSAAIYVNAKWKPFLSEKIKAGVFEGSNHLYRLDFDDLHLNVLTGSATLDSVTLLPDTAIFKQLKKNRMAPVHLFEVRMPELRLTRIGILTAYFKKRINMNAIILDHPSINMIHYKVPKKTDTVKDQRTLYQQISESLKSIHIRTIKVLNADFDYLNGESGKTLNSVRKLNVNVTDVLIDSISQFDKSRFFYTKDVAFEIANYKSVSKDKMYTFKIDSVSGSASKGDIRIKGLQVIPMYPDLEFSRKYPTQRDRYDFNFKSLKIGGLDFTRFNAEGLVYARSATIGPAEVKIFMNRELRPASIDKGSNFPHIALKRTPFPLIIDTLFLNQVNVAYTEFNAMSQQRGTVHIDRLRGKILNVSSDSLQNARHPQMVASLKSRIMRAADLDVVLRFNMLDPNGAFNYTGNSGPFNMTALNPIARSLGLMSIEKGKVSKIDFNIDGNRRGSHGTMRMQYTDLKVEMLKEGEDGKPLKKRGLLSFLANELIIKDANPRKNDPLRVATVSYVRPPSSSFFSLLWKGVFVGMRETIGIGFIKPKTPQQAYKKVQAKQSERKEKREQKREEKRDEKKKAAEEKDKADKKSR